MSRQEFLQRLRDTLTGEVPGNVIEENIRYYDDYIRTETAGGQTEDEVTGAIGDPRLIAKTIMEATENAREGGSYQSAYDTYRNEGQTVYEEEAGPDRHFHFVDLNKWYWKLLAVVVTVFFFFLVASIVTGIFSILIPLMGPLLLILLVIWLIRGPRR